MINSPSDLTPSPTLIDATEWSYKKSILVKLSLLVSLFICEIILNSLQSVPNICKTGKSAVGPHS